MPISPDCSWCARTVAFYSFGQSQPPSPLAVASLVASAPITPIEPIGTLVQQMVGSDRARTNISEVAMPLPKRTRKEQFDIAMDARVKAARRALFQQWLTECHEIRDSG